MLICVIGNNRISILQPNSSGLVQPCVDTSFSDNGSICFRSDPEPKATSLPVLLCVVGFNHPYCSYKWECLSKPNMEFPSTPVVFVNADLFKCSVISAGNVIRSVHFDIIQDFHGDSFS